ncbi:MAG: M24 family metallopeptidase [Candidatus Levyibacteriota bacterium]
MQNRLQKLRKLLAAQNLDAVLISSVPNIIYFTGYANFSHIERDGYLLITKDKNYLITSALYYHEVKDAVKHFEIHERTRNRNTRVILQELLSERQRCGFEASNLTVAEHTTILPSTNEWLPVDLSLLREKKDPEEIDATQEAARFGDKVFDMLLQNINRDISEKSLATFIEITAKQADADISFAPVIAFGENAAIPHHHTGHKKLAADTCILMDFGIKKYNYCSDMTRTVFFGKPSATFIKIYQTTLDAQKKSIEYITNCLDKNEPVIAGKIDQTGRDYIVSRGFPPFNHSSHGIGLEVHEAPHLFPDYKNHVEENMVFSIEPGIYLPSEMGVRIEDDFAIQNNKLIQLTKSSRELIEI